MKLFSRLGRLLAASLLLALTLALTLAGAADAATSNTDEGMSPVLFCISATPYSQSVVIGDTAHLTINVNCPLPPQPVANAQVHVTWGDGSDDYYTYCLEVCHVNIDAEHQYRKIGDYTPTLCMAYPTPINTPPPCTSVKIQVTLSSSTSCISVTPISQSLFIGQTAHLAIRVSCPLPPNQPYANAQVHVIWGDGSDNYYTYCREVCYAVINADHQYQRIGAYAPTLCMVYPPSTVTTAPPCTSVKIQVAPPPPM
jgi:hypothetical protein